MCRTTLSIRFCKRYDSQRFSCDLNLSLSFSFILLAGVAIHSFQSMLYDVESLLFCSVLFCSVLFCSVLFCSCSAKRTYFGSPSFANYRTCVVHLVLAFANSTLSCFLRLLVLFAIGFLVLLFSLCRIGSKQSSSVALSLFFAKRVTMTPRVLTCTSFDLMLLPYGACAAARPADFWCPG